MRCPGRKTDAPVSRSLLVATDTRIGGLAAAQGQAGDAKAAHMFYKEKARVPSRENHFGR
jgi:hypothetical protein